MVPAKLEFRHVERISGIYCPDNDSISALSELVEWQPLTLHKSMNMQAILLKTQVLKATSFSLAGFLNDVALFVLHLM